MKIWTENFVGNVHAAATQINANDQLVFGLLSLHSPDGLTTIAVFRITDDQYVKLQARRLGTAHEEGEVITLSGGADGVVFDLDKKK